MKYKNKGIIMKIKIKLKNPKYCKDFDKGCPMITCKYRNCLNFCNYYKQDLELGTHDFNGVKIFDKLIRLEQCIKENGK